MTIDHSFCVSRLSAKSSHWENPPVYQFLSGKAFLCQDEWPSYPCTCRHGIAVARTEKNEVDLLLRLLFVLMQSVSIVCCTVELAKTVQSWNNDRKSSSHLRVLLLKFAFTSIPTKDTSIKICSTQKFPTMQYKLATHLRVAWEWG